MEEELEAEEEEEMKEEVREEEEKKKGETVFGAEANIVAEGAGSTKTDDLTSKPAAAPVTTEATSGERDAVIGKAEQTKVNPHKLAVGDEEEARGLGSFRHPRPLHRARERRQARLTLEEQRRSGDLANERPLDLKTNQYFQEILEIRPWCFFGFVPESSEYSIFRKYAHPSFLPFAHPFSEGSFLKIL